MCRAIAQGVTTALSATGLDATDLDLIPALYVALTQHDAMNRWLSGEAVFSDAYIREGPEEALPENRTFTLTPD